MRRIISVHHLKLVHGLRGAIEYMAAHRAKCSLEAFQKIPPSQYLRTLRCMVRSSQAETRDGFHCSGCLVHTFQLLRAGVEAALTSGVATPDQFADFLVSYWLVRDQFQNPRFPDLASLEDHIKPLDFPDIASGKARVHRSNSQGESQLPSFTHSLS